MKPIIKIVGLICLVMVFQPAQSQLKGFGIGPYLEMGWPTGKLAETHQRGIGIGLSADIKLPGKLGITGSAGYMQFSGQRFNDGKVPALKALPLRAGLKYRPIPLLYFKMEAGTAQQMGQGNDGTSFLLSPGIGIRILGLDIQGKYETWFNDVNSSFWGIRAGINF